MEAINTAKAAKLTETLPCYIVSPDERERVMAARDIAQDRVAELTAVVSGLEHDSIVDAVCIGRLLEAQSLLQDELDTADDEVRGCAFIDGFISLVIVGVVTGVSFAVACALLEYLG